MKIQNAERNEQPLVFEVATKAMSMMEISKIHINNKPCCAVCKEQFWLGVKVLNIPWDHFVSFQLHTLMASIMKLKHCLLPRITRQR
ncbi:hypothetical protein E1A91_D10G081800v1 [Gossypium mustelinum]|uniref:Uncharacterized protein n=3 Tax=Gossypium TaxID=3633 RepID=A0A5J5PNX3_GOSBA|nr:hypothetical protein ES319_D10G077200v1 [Gossypium barbadense]TYH48659.1 hypothetical protein ES332_D10G082900v1 [Gossypium tomentosum]TYI60088.1 hypothetical protein E1A91_D10G081800v1 [Gossypium mustelinum]